MHLTNLQLLFKDRQLFIAAYNLIEISTSSPRLHHRSIPPSFEPILLVREYRHRVKIRVFTDTIDMKYSRKPWREFLRVPSRSRVRNWLLANSSPRSLKTGKWSRIFPLNRANCSLTLQLAVISHDALRLYSRIIMRHVLEEADNLMHRNYHPSHNLISNGWKYSSLLIF